MSIDLKTEKIPIEIFISTIYYVIWTENICTLWTAPLSDNIPLKWGLELLLLFIFVAFL